MLAVVGTVIWTREKRGHWSGSSARRDTEECNISSPALHILAACRKKAAVPKATCGELVALGCPAFFFFPKKPRLRFHGTAWWM